MAFIRRVPTGSGATAVQVAEYVSGGGQRILKHVGSAHTDAELGVLMEQAREFLTDRGQGVLELDVAESAPVVRLSKDADAPVLFALDGEPAGRTGRDGLGRVVGTDSRLLYQTLAGVYAGLGFDVLDDEVFKDLVIARVVEPTSLLDSGRVLAELGQGSASYSTLRRTLSRVGARGYRDQIATACFKHAASHGDLSLIMYDLTTLYFEADQEDSLRKVGYSKERRVDPQIVVGLLVDRQGFPLEIGCWEGNTAEKHTIIPIVTQFQARHGLADLVVVADAGMLSAANLTALDEAGLRFIVGSKVTKAPGDLASHFHWHGDGFTDGQLIDTITPKSRKASENNPKVKAEPTWEREQHPNSWRAVWAYSSKRFARDNKTLTAQENRALAVIAGEKATRTPRFVKNNGGKKVLDAALLARARRLAGLKGYVTNMPAETMPPVEVIASYHDLWQVERSFRMSKSDLRARPLFARQRDSIEAHLTIVFTALAISRLVQDRTGLSIRNVLRQIRPLRSATLAINGTTRTFPPQIPTEQQALLDALKTDEITH